MVSRLHPRTWSVGDPVARPDRSGPEPYWQLGTVTGVDPDQGDQRRAVVLIRWDDDDTITVRRADDPALTHADDVPIDERAWLPQRVRDQLVRQEAAGRLFEFARRLIAAGGATEAEAAYLRGIADGLDDLLNGDLTEYGDAARALLNPAPAPATYELTRRSYP